MRIETTKLVDAGQLARDLTVTLGTAVACSTRAPGQFDSQGLGLPGLVVLLNPATGDELDDLDLTTIQAVIAAHVPPEPHPGPHRRLAEAAEAATTVAGLKAALLEFAQATDPLTGHVEAAAHRLGRTAR